MNIHITDFRPPKIAQLLVLVAAVLNWTTPLGKLQIYSNRVPGIVLGIFGFAIMIWSWWLFKKVDTAICPTSKSDYLVTSGIFRVTRNPMYLGMIAMLFAMAIFVGTLPFYLAGLAYFVIINNFFCPYEENKLAQSFGDSYLSYKSKVGRWL